MISIAWHSAKANNALSMFLLLKKKLLSLAFCHVNSFIKVNDRKKKPKMNPKNEEGDGIN